MPSQDSNERAAELLRSSLSCLPCFSSASLASLKLLSRVISGLGAEVPGRILLNMVRNPEPKPLRYAQKKAAPKRQKNVLALPADKNFRVHQHDESYRTLTVPIDAYDVDDIRTYLKKTTSQWSRPFETRVACRLIEAFALSLSPDDFIGHSTVIPPQRFFEPQRTITVGLWIPMVIAERLTVMKQLRSSYRKLSDTEAVRIFLIEAVARYIRPFLKILDPEVIGCRSVIVSADKTGAATTGCEHDSTVLQEELKMLRTVNAELEKKVTESKSQLPDTSKRTATMLQRKLSEVEGEYEDSLRRSIAAFTAIAGKLEVPVQKTEFAVQQTLIGVIDECKSHAAMAHANLRQLGIQGVHQKP
jgi:hypothetical protein